VVHTPGHRKASREPTSGLCSAANVMSTDGSCTAASVCAICACVLPLGHHGVPSHGLCVQIARGDAVAAVSMPDALPWWLVGSHVGWGRGNTRREDDGALVVPAGVRFHGKESVATSVGRRRRNSGVGCGIGILCSSLMASGSYMTLSLHV
jgi:hypothetical protein